MKLLRKNFKKFYYPKITEKTVPSFWMAFTPSDSKEALDLMNEAADAPLTLAKMHGTE